MKTLLAPAAFAMLATAFAAQAQPVDGLYIAGGAGGNLMPNEQISRSAALAESRHNVQLDAGYRVNAAIGYGLAGFGIPVRIELEGDYLNNHIRSVTLSPVPLRAGGYEAKYGAMVNAYYDIDLNRLGIPSPIFPYVGIGGGELFRSLQGFNYSQIGSPIIHGGNGNVYGHYAVQGIAGFAYPLPVTGLSATLEYRFTTLPYPVTGNTGYVTNASGAPVLFGHRDFNYNYNNSILVGLRYAFDEPSPPPAPMPAPVAPPPAVQPVRTYLVFFDWDRADLNDRARQIVAEAASASTHVQSTQIEVNGYTDLSGTATYNQALSVRRAKTVQMELVKDGVPQSAIEIHGYGETHPLVPTAAGVREPQNRRVEIILH